MNDLIRLPVLHHTNQAKPAPFANGALVRLRTIPHGAPGVVTGMTRGGKVCVFWHDINFNGHHRAETLMLVTDTIGMENFGGDK